MNKEQRESTIMNLDKSEKYDTFMDICEISIQDFLDCPISVWTLEDGYDKELDFRTFLKILNEEMDNKYNKQINIV